MLKKILFIFFCQLSYSQVDSIKIYYEKGKIDKAIEFGENFIKNKQIKNEEYATAINNIAVSYSKLGLIIEAENYYSKYGEIIKLKFGENNIEYAIYLNNLGQFYLDLSEYDKAESMFLKSLEIKKINSGENNQSYTITLNNLALLYKKKLEFNKAKTIYLKTLEIKKKIIGEEDLSYITTLGNLANIYIDTDSISKAKPLLLKSVEITKNKLGLNHPDYARTLNNLGYYYKKIEDYPNSEIMYLEALTIIENNFGVDHSSYIDTLDNLAELYIQQDLFSKAEPLLDFVLEIKKRKISQNNLDYANTLSKLAFLYLKQYDFKKSEFVYLKVIEITKKKLGEKHPDYAKSLYELAFLYYEKGEYFKTQYLVKEVSEIYKSNSNKYHSNYLLSLNFLGLLYNKIGEFNKSEEIFLTALDIEKKKLKENGKIYSILLHNLALLYDDQDNLDKAEQLILNSINIKKSILNIDKIELAASLNLLGVLNVKKGNLDVAESYYNQSLEIVKNKFGEFNPNYAIKLDNLAILYEKKEDFKNSERLHLKAIEILKQTVGEDHPDYLIAINNLSLYYHNNDFSKASNYIELVLSKLQNKLIKLLVYLSENELKLNNINEFYKQHLSLSYLNLDPNNYPNINSATLNTELLLKNLTLRNQQRIKKSIEQSNDSVLKEKYEQFVANKRFLTKLEEQPIDKRPENYETLKAETEILEKDITRLSSTFAEGKKSLLVTWQDVQQKLKPNEVVIDLVSYNYYNKKWTDSIMYGAFVFDKNSKFPKFVSLFEEKQLTQLLQRDSQANDSIQEKIINQQYANKSISDLFLKPLEQELQNAKTIYVTPSGLAHQINFKALPFQNTTFGETFSVHILGSSAGVLNLASTHLSKNKNMEFHLFGGIDYNKVSKEEIIPSENQIVSRSIISSFGYLQGTEKEVNEIAKTAQNQGFNTILKTDRNATEESIKQLDGKKTPFVLHIATHGFFFENPKVDVKEFSLDNKFSVYKTSDDPMLRSGLAFAGANKNFKSTIIENEADDGILTAKEISNLDLSTCELVVLSACETGLGEINGSEGVFGLQRAFKMAGVKNIIMSLWKVPDAQTSELFEIFYKECFSGKSIKEAFQVAQSKMKEKYTPYYWAGFILLE
jgi:CHAT domain-containing protein